MSPSYHEFSIGHSILSWHHSNKIHYCYIVPNLIIESEDIEDDQKSESQILISRSFFVMDFSLLTTSGVSQKRNEAVGNTKPPAMRVEDKLLYKKNTFPL